MASSAFKRIVPLALGAFTATLDNNILNVCLPLLVEELNGDVGLAQFVASAYTFTICGLLLIFAYISPVFGRRKVFSAGTGLFAVGSILAAQAGGLDQLIACRIVQGVGAAMFMANGMALVNTHFDHAVKGRAFGIMSSAIAVASMAGPVLGGAVAAHFGWRAVFYALAPLALLAAVSAHGLLNAEKPAPVRPLDRKGMAASSLSVLAFFGAFLFLQRQQVAAFAGMLIVSGITAYCFVRFGGAAKRPLLEMELFSNRVFVRANVSSAGVYAVMMGCSLLLPFYAQGPLNLSVTESGWLMAATAAAIFAVSYYGGRLADRRGGRFAVRTGLLALAAGMLILEAGIYLASEWILVVANLVFGAGIGIFNPANNKIVMESVDLRQGAAAASVNVLVRNGGIAVGTAAAGILYAGLLAADYDPAAAMLWLGGGMVAAVLILLIYQLKCADA